MESTSIRKLGQNRGIPRVWIDGQQPLRAGFLPGKSYSTKIDRDNLMITLQLVNNDELELVSPGGRIRTVTKQQKRGQDLPVIDINSNEALAMFEGMDALRVICSSGKIYILPLASVKKQMERINTLHKKLDAKEPITFGSVAHGGGVLSHAIHEGFKKAGIPSKLSWANEIRDELLDYAASNNDAWTSETQYLAMPLQEMAFDSFVMDRLNQVDVLEAGISCSGASVAGRAKRGLSIPEEHPDVGHLMVGMLAIVAKVNPAVCVIENVESYQNSASACLFRNQMRDMGYEIHEAILDSAEWNALEHRKRLVLVAVTRGLKFDFAMLEKPQPMERKLGEILEPMADDDERWKTFSYLREKEVRDKEAGKGFAMQLFDADSPKVATITKGYAKIRSTDPKIKHPTNPDLMRQLLPEEHARAKETPVSLIANMCATLAHEMLGQSVIHSVFVSLGKLIAECLQSVEFALSASRTSAFRAAA